MDKTLINLTQFFFLFDFALISHT